MNRKPVMFRVACRVPSRAVATAPDVYQPVAPDAVSSPFGCLRRSPSWPGWRWRHGTGPRDLRRRPRPAPPGAIRRLGPRRARTGSAAPVSSAREISSQGSRSSSPGAGGPPLPSSVPATGRRAPDSRKRQYRRRGPAEASRAPRGVVASAKVSRRSYGSPCPVHP